MRLSEVHDEDVLTPKQVASALNLCASTVRKAIAAGELRGHRLGARKGLLVKGKAVREWLDANEVKAKPTNLGDSVEERQNGQTANGVSTSMQIIDRAVASVFR